MTLTRSDATSPAIQRATEKAFSYLDKFIHIEAASGVLLLLAAAIALYLANSSISKDVEHFWHLQATVGVEEIATSSRSLHFIVNDVLMTFFFLIVGMEIRREIHDGALTDFRQAILPIGAACGGVFIPAIVYLTFCKDAEVRAGWAIPTATDIAFAVGVLSLLGKSVPGSARIFLLTLAIVDDIAAILIIAFKYSSGLDPAGFAIASVGLVIVLLFQRMGFGSAFAYLIPGAMVWSGFMIAGIHPTLAGVILGLMTPVSSRRVVAQPLDYANDALNTFEAKISEGVDNARQLARPIKQLAVAQRELLPPVIRVPMALHPWVAFTVMPLFAFANAGVNLGDLTWNEQSQQATYGIALALVLGKPVGVAASCYVLIKLRICELTDGLSWQWIGIVALLTGVGFTMSIFIANLAFAAPHLLSAAKMGVLLGSSISAVTGLIGGFILVRSNSRKISNN